MEDSMSYNDWLAHFIKIVNPVLEAYENKNLITCWNPQFPPGALDRNHAACARVEMLARVMLGAAPLFSIEGNAEVDILQKRIVGMVDVAFQEKYIEISGGEQLLIEFGNIAWAFVRSPQFWKRISSGSCAAIVNYMRAMVKKYPAHNNNWLLYKSVIHVFLNETREARSLLAAFESFYVGDGWYKDGSVFHMDYYNSFVITPLLVDIYKKLGLKDGLARACARLGRQAVWLERQIGPDGTFPIFGRSMVYRTAVFHALVYACVAGCLPPTLRPSQIRCGLSGVLERMFGATSNNFDEHGFLHLGFLGHDPELANIYSNSGSCYFALVIFAVLGLDPRHEFWSGPACDWTQKRAWTGQSVLKDIASTI
jgi:hypothetical protein